ncbi:MAG: AI-2E family transporter [Bacteroidetes bacterium SW_9_63_38]|nr:MAG: AI-2E family transporter [Bacteroidetes bacterium SW_9_63_38]
MPDSTDPSSPTSGPAARDERTAVSRDEDRARDESPPAVSPTEEADNVRSSPSGGNESVYTLDRIVRFLLGAATAGIVGWLLWYFAGLVLYLVVGGVLAYLLRPVVDWLQSHGLRRVSAILGSFVLLLGAVSVIVTSIVPFVGQQVQELSQLISVDLATDVATYVENRVRQVTPIEPGVIVDNVERMAQALMQGDLVKGDQVAGTVSSVVALFTNIVYAVVIIPFVTFFLLKDGLEIRRSLLWLVPNQYFEVTLAILDKVEGNIGRYLSALLIQCTSIAVIASVLLWGVGLQNAIAIGIFTGLANTIPYFGPFLGFVCGTLVGIAQTGNFVLVPWVALAMALTQLADNVLLQPIIFSRAAKAHPLVILFVVLIGARLGGIIGMLIAIPLTTTVRVVVEQVLWSLHNYRILRSSS